MCLSKDWVWLISLILVNGQKVNTKMEIRKIMNNLSLSYSTVRFKIIKIFVTFRTHGHFTQRVARCVNLREHGGVWTVPSTSLFHPSNNYFHHFSFTQPSATPWIPLRGDCQETWRDKGGSGLRAKRRLWCPASRILQVWPFRAGINTHTMPFDMVGWQVVRTSLLWTYWSRKEVMAD